MTTPDFSKIWASASPLPTFTFTDAEYTEGWDFVGSAPPTKNQFDAWFKSVDERLKWLYDQMQATASKLYPVGSVYISFNATDPSTLFGGTWVRLKDRFLLASGDAYAANTTGGSATKTITTNNLPSHTHSCSTTTLRGTFASVARPDRRTDPTGIASATYSNSQIAGGNTDADWQQNITINATHTHTIGNTGSGLPLNIMPPYQTVYMWRRTA